MKKLYVLIGIAFAFTLQILYAIWNEKKEKDSKTYAKVNFPRNEKQIMPGKANEIYRGNLSSSSIKVYTNYVTEESNLYSSILNYSSNKSNKHQTGISSLKPDATTKNITKPSSVETCPVTWIDQWEVPNIVPPRINLDGNKYLLPLPINGPNNQIQGLWESLYIAIRLNRTFVIPPLFKHASDRQHSTFSTIHPGHRIDLDVFRQLASCITLTQYHKLCNGTIEALLAANQMNSYFYHRIEQSLKIKIYRNEKVETLLDFVHYPRSVSLPLNRRDFLIDPNPKNIRLLYGSEESCALLPFLYGNVRLKLQKPSQESPKSINLDQMSNQELFEEIIRFTQTPLHIKELAQNFWTTIMKNQSYLSVHWRYDSKDWMADGCLHNPNLKGKKRKLCDNVANYEPIDLAQAISDAIQNISNNFNISTIYIATAPGALSFVTAAKHILKNDFKYQAFNSNDLKKFLHVHYKSCEWLWPDFDDILSTTEMEICTRASYFLKSGFSSWSRMVKFRRKELPISTADVIDKFVELANNRRKSNEAIITEHFIYEDIQSNS